MAESNLEVKNRCSGLLIGLAAGDRNGGPIRLALRLTENIFENKCFNQESVVERYYNYFRGPPHDIERAFDTGQTFHSVFKLYSQGKSIAEAAETVQNKYGSIGIGTAHRNAVLAMAPFITEKDLPQAVHDETFITHANPISFEVSLFVTILCREVIRGSPWKNAIETAQYPVKEAKVKIAINSVGSVQIANLSKDGYAPAVLQAALYFLNHEKSFSEALNASISFAGSGNFCPVLVGSIGGARYGANVILEAKDDLLKHCDPELVDRVSLNIEKMRSLW